MTEQDKQGAEREALLALAERIEAADGEAIEIAVEAADAIRAALRAEHQEPVTDWNAWITDASRDEYIEAFLDTLAKAADRETERYMTRWFMGGWPMWVNAHPKRGTEPVGMPVGYTAAPASQPVYDKSVVARIATQMGWTAPASQPEGMRECRHCGWMCAPNAAPSKKGYTAAPASQPVGEAVAQGLTGKQRTAIEHAIGLAGAARMHGTADALQSILAQYAPTIEHAVLARYGQPAQEGM